MMAVVLTAAVMIAQAPAPAVKAPGTPAGQALTEFVSSFNAGGDRRRAWVETRTTVPDGPRASMLSADAARLQQNGPMTVVRILASSPEKVTAVVRHGRSRVHGHVAIDVEPAAPFKVVRLDHRAATPEEIKGTRMSLAMRLAAAGTHMTNLQKWSSPVPVRVE